MKLNPNNIRITISWQNVFPIMKACSGIFKIECLNEFNNKFNILVTGKAIMKNGIREYKNIKYIDKIDEDDFMKHISPYISIMVKSYYKGMILNNDDWTWIMF